VVSVGAEMLIHFDGGSIETDNLVLLERQRDFSVLVQLKGEEPKVYRGLEAQQIWSQINEHAETIDGPYPLME
jgi:hypothetical protein